MSGLDPYFPIISHINMNNSEMQAGAWTHIASGWDGMRRYTRPPLQGCHLLGMSCRTLGHVYYCTQDSLHEMPSVATPGLHDFKGVIYWLCHVEHWDTWVIYRTLLQTGFRSLLPTAWPQMTPQMWLYVISIITLTWDFIYRSKGIWVLLRRI